MKLLFICTGNTCRSPLAEAIARRVAIDRGLTDVEAVSAGTSAWPGAPASDGALLVGIERSIDLSHHRAQSLTRELVQASDMVFAMGPHHLERVEALGGAGKAHLLVDYASKGQDQGTINDPFGGDLDAYREACDELERVIRLTFDRMSAERSLGR